MDRYAELLHDAGALLNVPLQPDTKRACRIGVDGKIHLQLQEEENKDRILIATYICEIPPGKFRENVLKETLKENEIFPRLGTFGYSERQNKLALFSYVYFLGLSADTFVDFVGSFLEKALSWKTAIETGQLPRRGQNIKKTGPSIFDIKK